MQQPPRTSRRAFVGMASALVVAAALVSACSADPITQPNVTARHASQTLSTSSLTSLLSVVAFTRDTAVTSSITRSFTFDAKGGAIDIKETGLHIDVPADAIPSPTLTISVTVLQGKAIAYDFQPHGTVFLKPLVFRQDLSNTTWDKLGFTGVVNGGYFKSVSQINLQKGTALLDELFPVTFDKKVVSFNIGHFSGYMVSGGRTSATSDEAAF